MKRFGVLMATTALGAAVVASSPAAAFRGGQMGGWHGGGWRGAGWHGGWNRGYGSIDWVERIPFTETRNYVQRVIENLSVYRVRLGETEPTSAEALLKAQTKL